VVVRSGRALRLEAALAGFGVATVVGMHAGTVFKPLGTVGTTRWADWVDLLTPWAVLGAAALVLLAARAPARGWVALAVGGLLFAEGHGLHLSANSVGNVSPSPTAHLWDEVVSHYVWYVGFAVVLAVLAWVLVDHPLRVRPVGWLLTVLVGVTLFSNHVEGGTPVLGLATALLLGGYGWRRRSRPAGRLLLVTCGVAAVLLVGWGAYWRGFPQFSSIGWI
jgi:hypothetical protein